MMRLTGPLRSRGLARLGVSLALVVAACTGGDAEQDSRASTSPRPPPSTTAVPLSTTEPVPATTRLTQPPVVDTRRPVILDYSPTVSDLGALVFLASHPDLRLIGVTLPGTGESHCEPGVSHTRGVLEQLGKGEVPVVCGPEDPVTGFNAFPTSWRIQSDEIGLPEATPNEKRTAPELISDLVRGETTAVEIVAVAPLTNLAVALRDDPGLAEMIAGITIMGGAVEVPGNVFRNEVGEWNIWVDPTAAGMSSNQAPR